MEFTLADLRMPYMSLRLSFANDLTFSLFLFTFLIISYRIFFLAFYITKQVMHDRVKGICFHIHTKFNIIAQAIFYSKKMLL